METINVVTYADNSYVQHACVMLASLNDRVAAGRECHVYFFYSNCKPEALVKLESTVRTLRNLVVKLIPCAFGLEKQLKPKKSYMSSAIYDKLLIYETLPSHIRKVLFLDADIVLLSDPALLYDLDLNGKILAAVKDEIFKTFSGVAKDTIGVAADQYFNSGVMLVDLDQWKEFDISQKALDFCITKGHLTPLHDQDAFNYVVQGNWNEISPLWNPRVKNAIVDDAGNFKVLSKYDVYAKRLAYLIHFSGANKPWLYMTHHPLKKIYLRYLKKTAFADYKFPDYSRANFVRKQINRLKRAIKRMLR